VDHAADISPVGLGECLEGVSPYIFRIALSNNRIERVANDAVTFRSIDGKTGAQRQVTLPVNTFIGRFLGYVLPKALSKSASYGLLCVAKRQLLPQARRVLALGQAAPPPPHAAAWARRVRSVQRGLMGGCAPHYPLFVTVPLTSLAQCRLACSSHRLP
jgi:Putative transposase